MTYEEKQAHYSAVWESGGRTVIEPRPLRAVKLCRIICPSCGTVFYGEEADPKTHRHRCQDHKERSNNPMSRKNTTPQLSPEAVELRRAYRREWNAAHPEAVKRYNRQYWERKAAAARAARTAAQEQEDRIHE